MVVVAAVVVAELDLMVSVAEDKQFYGNLGHL